MNGEQPREYKQGRKAQWERCCDALREEILQSLEHDESAHLNELASRFRGAAEARSQPTHIADMNLIHYLCDIQDINAVDCAFAGLLAGYVRCLQRIPADDKSPVSTD